MGEKIMIEFWNGVESILYPCLAFIDPYIMGQICAIVLCVIVMGSIFLSFLDWAQNNQ